MDHGPVLAAAMMHLQAEHLAGLDRQALDLAVAAVLEHGEAAPGPMHGLMKARRGVIALAQLLDDLLHLLRALAIGHQNGVAGIDDDQILHADDGDDALVALDVAVLAFDDDRRTAGRDCRRRRARCRLPVRSSPSRNRCRSSRTSPARQRCFWPAPSRRSRSRYPASPGTRRAKIRPDSRRLPRWHGRHVRPPAHPDKSACAAASSASARKQNMPEFHA